MKSINGELNLLALQQSMQQQQQQQQGVTATTTGRMAPTVYQPAALEPLFVPTVGPAASLSPPSHLISPYALIFVSIVLMIDFLSLFMCF